LYEPVQADNRPTATNANITFFIFPPFGLIMFYD
jgi:hypothetical protein